MCAEQTADEVFSGGPTEEELAAARAKRLEKYPAAMRCLTQAASVVPPLDRSKEESRPGREGQDQLKFPSQRKRKPSRTSEPHVRFPKKSPVSPVVVASVVTIDDFEIQELDSIQAS